MVLVNVVGRMLSDRTLATFEALFGEVTKNVFCGDFARLSVCPFVCNLLDLVSGNPLFWYSVPNESQFTDFSEHRVSNE